MTRRLRPAALLLLTLPASLLAQSDAILLQSSDGGTDVPRLVVTESSAGNHASVRVQSAILRLGSTAPVGAAAGGDIRYDAGTSTVLYFDTTWRTLLHTSSPLDASNISSGVVGATYGGTGQSAVATGDVLYGSAANTWSRLAVGGNGTFLRSNGSLPAWSALSSTDVGGFAFVQDGNSFGAAAHLGTNDGQALVLETGGTARMTIADPTGNITVGNVVTPLGHRLTVQGYTSGTGAIRGIDASGASIYAYGELGVLGATGLPSTPTNIGVLGVKPATGSDGVGVYAWNNDDATYNYAVYSNADGAGASNLGIQSWASGGSNGNWGGQFIAGTASSPVNAYGIETFVYGTGPKYGARLNVGSSTTAGIAYGVRATVAGSTGSKYGVDVTVGSGTQGGAAYGLLVNALSSNSDVYGALLGASTGNSVATSIGAQASGQDYDFYAAGTGVDYGSSSSIRWKRDVRPIPDALAKVRQLRGVLYEWDDEHGGGPDIGMIAEEVGKVVPEVVGFEANGVDARAMDYGRLTALLVEAIKEQQAEIDELRARLEERR